MRYRELGKSGVKVSEVSLGCWTMGGLNWVNGSANGWADVDEKEVARAIDFAIERGVNHFDNADVYGNGRAERMLARILGPRTREIIIATKTGHFPGTAEHAYEPQHIRHQCEQSLVNLKRDYIDLYYFHHGNFGPSDRYLDDALAQVHRLRAEGKIRLVGLSAYSIEDFVRLIPRVRPDVLQSWAHAMDTRYIEEGSPVRRLLDELDIPFVAFSPLAQGILLGKYQAGAKVSFEEGDHRRHSSQFSEENLARVALQYLLAHPCVGCVIPGFRDLRQVEMNLAGADSPLTPDDAAFVRRAMQ